jgi:hypothetical protein
VKKNLPKIKKKYKGFPEREGDSVFSRRKKIFRNGPVLQNTFCPAHQSAIQEAKCSSLRPTREATQNGDKFNHTFRSLRHVHFHLSLLSFPSQKPSSLHYTTAVARFSDAKYKQQQYFKEVR